MQSTQTRRTVVASTQGMTYDKARRSLSTEASTLGLKPGEWPSFLEIESHHTGNVVTFVRDDAEAQRHEWWDGELYEYRCLERRANAQRLVVFNT